MVALGWMNLLWMGLFAAIIFGEKIWSRGIWIARASGIGLAVVGVMVIVGMFPSILPSMSSMGAQDSTSGIPGLATRDNSGSHTTVLDDPNLPAGLPASPSNMTQFSAEQAKPAMTMTN